MSSQVAKPANAAPALAMPLIAEAGTSLARCTPIRSVKEIRKYLRPRSFATASRSLAMSPSPVSERGKQDQRAFMVGSSATRRDSPSELNANAVSRMAMPGAYICSGAISM